MLHQFNIKCHELILESVNKYNKNIKMLTDGLAKINEYLSLSKPNDKFRSEYEKLRDKYEFHLKLYTVPVKVTCYDKTEEYPSAADAMDYFREGLNYCDPDSSEAERYYTIIDRLSEGKTEVTDSYFE
jgi:hypothetical protein